MSPLIQEMCCYLSILASAVLLWQWRVQSLKEPPVSSLHLGKILKVLEACNSSKLLSFNLDIPLNVIGAVDLSLVFPALISTL